MNFNKAEKLLKKIKNYRSINSENWKHLKDLSKWLFIELQRQDFNERIKGQKINETNEKTEKKDKPEEK